MAALRGLRRVAHVYALVERMRAAELSVASGAVLEVEQVRVTELSIQRQEVIAGRAALIVGDRTEWALAQARRAAAEVRAMRLEQERTVREAARGNAVNVYRESRIDSEQMKSVAEAVGEERRVNTRRRAQIDADDRHLSRREWMRRQSENESISS